MERDELILRASTLFGERWQTPLSAATGIASRSIRRMAAGKQPVPAKLAAALRRGQEVMDLIAELTAEYDSSEATDEQLTEWIKSFVVEALARR